MSAPAPTGMRALFNAVKYADTLLYQYPSKTLFQTLSIVTSVSATYYGYKVLNFTGLSQSPSFLSFLGLDQKSIDVLVKSIVGKHIPELSKAIRQEMLTMTVQMGGLLITAQVVSLSLSLIAAYIQNYIHYAMGRPKLSTEYEFDTWTTRVLHIGSKAYGFVQEMILGEAIEKPLNNQAIFNEELQEQITRLKKGIINIRNHQGYFPNTLFYGPPGTGKTMIAREIAKEANMNFIVISGGGFAQFKNRGEHIKEINDLFERVNNSTRPTIIFIDEIEGLARKRDDLNVDSIQLLNTFLGHTGTPSKKFTIIGATNRPQDLDSAFKSRCDNKILIPPPGKEERMRMLHTYLPFFFGKDCFSDPFSPKFLQIINERIEGFTGRDIFKLCNQLVIAKATQDDNKLSQFLALKTVDQYIHNHTSMDDYVEVQASLGPSKDSQEG